MMGSTPRVAVLGEEGYQELELWYPVMRLREEGITVTVAAPQAESAYESRLGYPLLAEVAISDLDAVKLDAVILPGKGAGLQLGAVGDTATLVAAVHAHGGLVGVIGTGSTVLTKAGIDEASPQVVAARNADDLPSFFKAILRGLKVKNPATQRGMAP